MGCLAFMFTVEKYLLTLKLLKKWLSRLADFFQIEIADVEVEVAGLVWFQVD